MGMRGWAVRARASGGGARRIHPSEGGCDRYGCCKGGFMDPNRLCIPDTHILTPNVSNLHRVLCMTHGTGEVFRGVCRARAYS